MGQMFGFLFSILIHKRFLWLLLTVNVFGTIYGYMWYAKQMQYTLQEFAPWLVLFVPDSPTASLFFCFSLMYLIHDRYRSDNFQHQGILRQVVEAFAVITSIKYGIWAVWIIIFSAVRNDPIVWQEWMLIVSHSAMVVQVILYSRYYVYRYMAVLCIAIWTLGNDLIDYGFGVYPWLSRVLLDDLTLIQVITQLLSVLSIAAALFFIRFRRKFI